MMIIYLFSIHNEPPIYCIFTAAGVTALQNLIILYTLRLFLQIFIIEYSIYIIRIAFVYYVFHLFIMYNR